MVLPSSGMGWDAMESDLDSMAVALEKGSVTGCETQAVGRDLITLLCNQTVCGGGADGAVS